MNRTDDMQDFFKPDGPLKWLWWVIPLAVVGVALAPNGKKTWREVIVMLFVAITLALFSAEAVNRLGGGEHLAFAICAVSVLIGRNILVFFMDVSNGVLSDDELREELSRYIRDWLKGWMKKKNGS